MCRFLLLMLYYVIMLAVASSQVLGYPQGFRANGHSIERRGTGDKEGSKKQPAKSWSEIAAPHRIQKTDTAGSSRELFQSLVEAPKNRLHSPPRKGSPVKDTTFLEHDYDSSSPSPPSSPQARRAQVARRRPQRSLPESPTQPQQAIRLPRPKSSASPEPIKLSKPQGMIGHGHQSAVIVGHGPASLFMEGKGFERDVNISPGKTKAISIGSKHHDVAAEGRSWGGSVTAAATGDVTLGFFKPRGGKGYAREGLYGEQKERTKPGEVMTGPNSRDESPPRGAASSLVHMEGEGQVGVVGHRGRS